MNDSDYMKRALELARQGRGLVSPNPMVGALLVKDDRVVGEGWHRYDLLKHAEVYAVESAGAMARGATLYCSLEPCCHHGRTPPCTDALIEAGITRAVIAMGDPDPRVGGRGIEQLREAGISVEVGLCEGEARKLNEAYLKFVRQGLPFLHGVVLCENEGVGQWMPSNSFLELASSHDAVVFGSNQEVNRQVFGFCASRKRHREFLYTMMVDDSGSVDSLSSSSLTEDLKNLEGSEFAQWLTSERAVSVIFLPGSLDEIESLDKLTFITPKSRYDITSASSQFECGGMKFQLLDVETADAGDYFELTGYPGLIGQAKPH